MGRVVAFFMVIVGALFFGYRWLHSDGMSKDVARNEASNAGKAAGAGPGKVDLDSVSTTVKAMHALEKVVSIKYSAASIVAYRNVTAELLADRVLPPSFIKDGRGVNAWGGRVFVQVFPKNAVMAGVPETINIVLESLPEKPCIGIVKALSTDATGHVFRINLEPSKRVHSGFPIQGDTGCVGGVNNIGFTYFAR